MFDSHSAIPPLVLFKIHRITLLCFFLLILNKSWLDVLSNSLCFQSSAQNVCESVCRTNDRALCMKSMAKLPRSAFLNLRFHLTKYTFTDVICILYSIAFTCYKAITVHKCSLE